MFKVFLVVFFYMGMAFAEPSDLVVQVINLDYVPANKMITELKPFLLPGDIVNGTGNRLILRVSKETLTQIKTIIQAMDVPPVVFSVSIQQGNTDGIDTSNSSTVYSASSRTKSGNAQSVTVLNGQSAFVSMGSERPIITSVSGGYGYDNNNGGGNRHHGHGGNHNNNNNYNYNNSDPGITYEQKEERQGFYIRPVLVGDKVKITIKRTRQQVSPTNDQASDNQALGTTTVIPLDKWVKLGQTGQEDTGAQNKAVSYKATNSYENDTTLYIKVNKQPQ